MSCGEAVFSWHRPSFVHCVTALRSCQELNGLCFMAGWIWNVHSATVMLMERSHPQHWVFSTHEPSRLMFVSVSTSQSQSLDLGYISDLDLSRTQQNRALFSAWCFRTTINSSAFVSEKCLKNTRVGVSSGSFGGHLAKVVLTLKHSPA